jgi:hypothetical protein
VAKILTSKEIKEKARKEPRLRCLCYGTCKCEQEQNAIDPTPVSESIYMPYYGGQWESNRIQH